MNKKEILLRLSDIHELLISEIYGLDIDDECITENNPLGICDENMLRKVIAIEKAIEIIEKNENKNV